jgi:parvulin-like peptidyl-prolyl isomerase
MNHKIVLFALFILATSAPVIFTQDDDREVVNEIRAVVYHKGGASPILTSDVRPSLDGAPRNLRDIVIEELMIVDAQRLNINVSEEDANRYLETLQKANHMPRAAMEKVMEEMGYTYQEGKEVLRRRQMVEQIIDYRIRSDKRFIVQREDVVAFDNAHPAYDEACYLLSQVCVPEAVGRADGKDLSQKELDKFAWEEPFEVKESELAEDKRFIANEKIGTIIDHDIVSDGIDLTRLVGKKPKRRVPVDERYDQILNSIRMERFEGLVNEYQDSLIKNSTVRFTYPEDKILVTEGA